MVCCSLRHRGEELLEPARRARGVRGDRARRWASRCCTRGPTGSRRGTTRRSGSTSTSSRCAAAGARRRRHRPADPRHLPRAWTVVGERRRRARRRDERTAFPFPHTIRHGGRASTRTRCGSRTTLSAHDGAGAGRASASTRTLAPVRARLARRAARHAAGRAVRRSSLPTGETEPVEPYAGPLGELTFDDGYDELAGGAVRARGRRAPDRGRLRGGLPRRPGVRAARQGPDLLRADDRARERAAHRRLRGRGAGPPVPRRVLDMR